MPIDKTPNAQQLLADSRMLFDAATVSQAVDRWALSIGIQLAPKLSRKSDKMPLMVISVMRGGLIPAAWLVQRLKLPLFLEYAHATRYQSGTEGHELEWKHQPAMDLRGQSVLIVDDIFDHGYTMQAIKDWCVAQNARQVWTAALVRKQHQQGLPRDWLDFTGLDVPDEYVFGCGMDIYEHWRHLPEIYAYCPPISDSPNQPGESD